LDFEAIGDKFYAVYDKHAPLLPLYITSLVALIISTVIDSILLISYLAGLPFTLVMTVLQSIIVAADIVFAALTAVQLNTTVQDNKVYDAEKEV
jgi:hypothetical protein